MKRIANCFFLALLLALAGVVQKPAAAEAAAPAPVQLYAANGVVHLTSDRELQAYAFTTVELRPAADSADWIAVSGTSFTQFKIDGTYCVWLLGTDGAVGGPYALTVQSDYRCIVDAEGLHYLKTPAEETLNVADANALIWRNVADAGVYTRAGVLSAALSVLTIFADAGATVPYQASGAYQQQDDWGVDPQWGAKLDKPITDANGTYYYRGMQCVASVVWAYKQAGLNLSNEGAGHRLGELGAYTRSGDNRIAYNKGVGGDIMVNGAHYLMIVDRLDTDGDGADDAYLTYEMRAPDLLVMVHSFHSIRYRELYSMDAVFENTGRLIGKARFWADTYCIPGDSFPEAFKTAVETSGERQAARRFLAGLGL